MATLIRETERKYEADTGTTVPSLAGLPGVAAESPPAEFRLEAEYFDTADLRLLRAGITLRRRRGGEDDGWHLKVPVGPDTRTELHVPLRRGRTVPAELARLVRAYARTAPLAPVARIATLRRQRLLLDGDGTSLAEVADDEVTAQSLGTVTALSQWREVEVELTGGGRPLLEAADQRLREAGLGPAASASKLDRALAGRRPAPARPGPLGKRATAAEVVLAYLSDQAAALLACDPAVRQDQPDAVHRMRVASRRLRSALQAFRPVIDAAATAHLREELQWLGQVLGAARDAEVLAGHLASLLDQVPPELVLGPVEASVTEHLAPRRATATRKVVRTLDSPRYLALLDELDALLAQPPLTALASGPASALHEPVARAVRRLARRVRRATSLPPGEARDVAVHDARKAAKRARYAAAALVPVEGKPARRLARRMKKIQSELGDHQDTVMARVALRDLGLRAYQAGENAFTYGLLYERDAQASHVFQEQAWHAWDKAARPKYRRWLRA